MKKIFTALLTLVLVTSGLAAGAVFLNNNSNFLTSILTTKISEESGNKVKTAATYEDHIEKGDLLVENGYYTLAITEFSLAAQDKPDASEPYVKIGEAHLYGGNYDKSLSNYTKAFEKSQQNVDAIIGMTQSYMHLEEFELARETIDGSANDDPAINYYRGMLYAYDGEYDRSKKLFEELVETDFAEEAQFFINAYQEYEAEQGGQDTHIRTLLAQAATDIEQYELAISILYQVLSDNASYRDAWILLGYAYLNLEEYQDSTSAFEQALELDITKPESNYFLALAYFGQDRYEESITSLELALVYGFEPQIQAYQKLAEIYFLLEDYESSSSNYEKVLELNDSDVNYFVRPIWLNMDYLDKIGHALELADWAVEAHPEDAMSYNLKGWVLIGMEKYDEAENYLEDSLNLDPYLAAAYLNYGTLSEARGDLVLAKDYYKQAYTLDQNDSVGALAAEKYNALL